MKPLLVVASFLLGVAVGQEPAGGDDAPFRVGGTFTGGTITAEVGGERLVLLVVEVGKDQTVYLHTRQKLGNAAVERVKRLTDLSMAQSKSLLKAAQTQKGADFKPAVDAIRKEFEEKRAAVDRVVVHGRVTAVGPVLADRRGIVVVGEVHDAATLKAAPRPGFAVVEGEVRVGKVDLGGGESAPFSVKAGQAAVAVAGKEAAGGVVRAAGRFRVTETGLPVIDAETVEAVRK